MNLARNCRTPLGEPRLLSFGRRCVPKEVEDLLSAHCCFSESARPLDYSVLSDTNMRVLLFCFALLLVASAFPQEAQTRLRKSHTRTFSCTVRRPAAVAYSV